MTIGLALEDAKHFSQFPFIFTSLRTYICSYLWYIHLQAHTILFLCFLILSYLFSLNIKVHLIRHFLFLMIMVTNLHYFLKTMERYIKKIKITINSMTVDITTFWCLSFSPIVHVHPFIHSFRYTFGGVIIFQALFFVLGTQQCMKQKSLPMWSLYSRQRKRKINK